MDVQIFGGWLHCNKSLYTSSFRL